MCEESRAERMAEERAQGSGSLALAGDLNAKLLSGGKRDLDKESTLNVFKNAAADRQFDLEAAIKNVEKMSNELKKLNVSHTVPTSHLENAGGRSGSARE